MNRLRVLSIAVLAWGFHPAFPTTITEFLAGARDETDVVYQDKKVRYLQRSPANIPIVDELELRVRNDGYVFDRQRYTLRLQPGGIGETLHGRRLHEARRSYAADSRELSLNRALKDRYQLVVEYLYRVSVLALDRQLETVYRDRLEVLRQRSNDVDFDPDRFIKAGDDLTDIRLKILRQENDIVELRREIEQRLPEGETFEFDTSQIIGLAAIDSLLANTQFVLDTKNVHLRRSLSRLRVEESRYRLENAQTRRYVSYLEFGYDRGEYLDQVERREEGRSFRILDSHIMGVGVTFPILNTDKLDVHRRKLELLDEQGQHEELKRQLSDDIYITISDMKTLLDEYKVLVARKEEMNAESYLQAYLRVDGVDPLLLLKAKESALGFDVDIERMRLDLYRELLKLLDVTGLLSQKPLVNHLSPTREPLAP